MHLFTNSGFCFVSWRQGAFGFLELSDFGCTGIFILKYLQNLKLHLIFVLIFDLIFVPIFVLIIVLPKQQGDVGFLELDDFAWYGLHFFYFFYFYIRIIKCTIFPFITSFVLQHSGNK